MVFINLVYYNSFKILDQMISHFTNLDFTNLDFYFIYHLVIHYYKIDNLNYLLNNIFIFPYFILNNVYHTVENQLNQDHILF